MATILQEFINAHLMEINPDDDEFKKLKKAASSLSKSEFRKREKVIKYTLVGIDPKVSPNEPLFEEVINKIEDKSPTLLSKSQDLPRTLLRAVILEALYTRALNDTIYARLVWYTAIDVIEFYKLGNEDKVLSRFLKEIGEKVEADAIKKWSTGKGTSKIEDVRVQLKNLDDIKLQINAFKKNFKNSILYTGWNGNNPSPPSKGNDNWGSHFANKGGDAIVELVQEALQKQNKNLKKIQDDLNKYLDQVAGKANGSIESLKNRNQLLWWKESLFSPLMKKSYRDVEAEMLPLVMAHDLNKLVIQNYPRSIDYLLKETIRNVLEKEMKVSLNEMIEILKGKDILHEVLPKKDISQGRTSLIHYLSKINEDSKLNNGTIDEKLGIDGEEPISLSKLALWLYHNFQAYKII